MLLSTRSRIKAHHPHSPTTALLLPFTPTALHPTTLHHTHPRGTGDNGRYSQIFGQLMNARSSINLAQSHLQCQLPYGYVHLILLVIHATRLANSIFSGIQLGHVLQARHAPRVRDAYAI